MFEIKTLLTYLAASLAIILAPGPAQALVLARSISDGRKAGILTGLGLNVGTVVHAVAAALGLSTILATSAAAFTIVKFLGAGYLVCLGIRTWLTETYFGHQPGMTASNPRQVFSKAVMIGILNPKVAIFFLAFLPQFVNPTRGLVFLQFLTLGLILALMDFFYESLLACVASGLSYRFTYNQRIAQWCRRMTGVVLVGLGLRLAFTSRD